MTEDTEKQTIGAEDVGEINAENPTPTTPNINDRFIKLLRDQLGIDPSKEITAESNFVDDLGCDSLDTVELLMAVEEEFNVEIPDHEAEKFETVGQASQYLQERVVRG